MIATLPLAPAGAVAQLVTRLIYARKSTCLHSKPDRVGSSGDEGDRSASLCRSYANRDDADGENGAHAALAPCVHSSLSRTDVHYLSSHCAVSGTTPELIGALT